MALKVLICLSILAFAAAKDWVPEEMKDKIIGECAEEHNISRDIIDRFAGESVEATTEMKDTFLCISRKFGVFDGMTWKREEIKQLVKEPSKISTIEECLKKDDETLEPRDRNFLVFQCAFKEEITL